MIHLESCFYPSDEHKFNIYSSFGSILASTSSQGKCLALLLSNTTVVGLKIKTTNLKMLKLCWAEGTAELADDSRDICN